MSRTPEGRITKADIEAKLAEIGGEVDDQVASTKQLAITAGAVAVAVVLAAVFLLGRRRGKKLTTIVEIRRV
ncbi:MAG: hypothetical protein ACXVJ7_18090 [Acidimicrobiia bacterium]